MDDAGGAVEAARAAAAQRNAATPRHASHRASRPAATPRRAPPSPSGPTTRTRRPADRYALVREVLAGRRDTAGIIAALKDSGLRGMGGAGFPTGRKWDMVAAQPATPRYVICNADESEPGTFKDRQILATQPHLVLEGMLLGMLAVGAGRGLGLHQARVRPGRAGHPRRDRAPQETWASSART